MYAALHNHSYYSLLDGVVSPEQLAQRAADLGIPALALTDHDALYGVVPFAQACEAVGITPLVGAELTVTPLLPLRGPAPPQHLTLLAANPTGYANLCRLITLARADTAKGEALLPSQHLAPHADGVICLSGCLDHGPIAQAIRHRDLERARQTAALLHALYGNRFYIELQRHYRREDYRISKQLGMLAHELSLPYVATPNAHYLDRSDAPVHDVLRCIKHRLPLDKAGGLLRTNAEYYLRPFTEMQALYVDFPDALGRTLEVAERCDFDLLAQLGSHVLPRWQGDSTLALRRLCERGVAERYGNHPPRQAFTQLEHELALIVRLGLCDYFILVWDIVHWARERSILCQGRGSAANSLVAYLLHITSVDPLSCGLVFERFLSEERTSPPDIDLDFSACHREEVIQYVYTRYGREHAAMVCTFNTFGARSAVRDAGFALGFPARVLDEIAKTLDQHSAAGVSESQALQQAFGTKVAQPAWRQLFKLSERLNHVPRHLGIHVGGMLLTQTALTDLVPVEPATMEGRTVVQWDKDAIEAAGMVKVDLLSLRALSAIEDALDQIERVGHPRPDLSGVSTQDRRVYDLIGRGETLGIFQVESRAQANVIPQMRPRSLADLTVQVALIRPGPIQGNMVHPYLMRRNGRQVVVYAHPLLEPILKETLGVMVFQEQVLKITRDLAGFTPGQGELLRRALGSKYRAEFIEDLRHQFIQGAIHTGVEAEIAGRIFEQLAAFGSFSFAKSHAASFALITYWHAWLRTYHPAAFFCGLLRNEPLGFYPVASVMADAQRAGVKLLHPEVNRSGVLPMLETDRAIRLGLSSVDGIGEPTAEGIVAARGPQTFTDLNDFIERTLLDRNVAERLILGGALDAFGERRQLLWDLAAAIEARGGQRLSLRSDDEDVTLKPFSPKERLRHEFAVLGGLIDAHLLDLKAEQYAALHLTPSVLLKQLRNGVKVRVGGVNAVRQRPPSAKGVAFLALEDKLGMMNIIVPKAIYERDRAATRAAFVVVDGAVQHGGGATNVIAERVRAIE